MLTVVFIVLMLFTFGTFLLKISQIDIEITNTSVARAQAYYNAESTLNLALAQLYANKAKLQEAIFKGDKIFSIEVPKIESDGLSDQMQVIEFNIQRKQVESKEEIYLNVENTGQYNGKYGQAKRNLRAQIQVEIINGWNLPKHGCLVTERECIINGVISLFTGTIYGNPITQNQAVQLASGQSSAGVLHEGELSEPLPYLTWDMFNDFIILDDWDGDLTKLLPGSYYLNNQNINFHGEYQGHLVLVFKENLTLDKAGAIDAKDENYTDNSLIVITLGNLQIKKEDNFSGIYMAPLGEIRIEKNLAHNEHISFVGSLISKDILILNENLSLSYNEKLADSLSSFLTENIFSVDLRFDVRYWQ